MIVYLAWDHSSDNHCFWFNLDEANTDDEYWRGSTFDGMWSAYPKDQVRQVPTPAWADRTDPAPAEEPKPLSYRQARKKRPDLLDRAVEAYLDLVENKLQRTPEAHEEVRKQYLAVRSHFDRIGRRERVQDRQARDAELARRIQESLD